MSPDSDYDEVPPEGGAALHEAAERLQRTFEGTFGTETVGRILLSSYAELVGTGKIRTWLPLLAERFTRERLTALSKVDGTLNDNRPVVLFLCTHNAGRSQMALGCFQALAGDRAIGWSGGSEPGEEVNPTAIAAMAEVGIDISQEFPKPWTDETVRAADVVVTMGCGDACPLFPGKRYEDWALTDPHGLGLDDVRPIREEIRTRVEELLVRLDILAGHLPAAQTGVQLASIHNERSPADSAGPRHFSQQAARHG